MNFLHALHTLLGQNAGHPQAGQSQPQLQHIPDNRGTGFRPQQIQHPAMQHMQPMQRHMQQPQQQGIPMHGTQMQQDAGGYGAPLENSYNPAIQGDPSQRYMVPQPQGGQFNPGYSPLQNSQTDYGRNPQHPFSIY